MGRSYKVQEILDVQDDLREAMGQVYSLVNRLRDERMGELADCLVEIGWAHQRAVRELHRHIDHNEPSSIESIGESRVRAVVRNELVRTLRESVSDSELVDIAGQAIYANFSSEREAFARENRSTLEDIVQQQLYANFGYEGRDQAKKAIRLYRAENNAHGRTPRWRR